MGSYMIPAYFSNYLMTQSSYCCPCPCHTSLLVIPEFSSLCWWQWPLLLFHLYKKNFPNHPLKVGSPPLPILQLTVSASLCLLKPFFHFCFFSAPPLEYWLHDSVSFSAICSHCVGATPYILAEWRKIFYGRLSLHIFYDRQNKYFIIAGRNVNWYCLSESKLGNVYQDS